MVYRDIHFNLVRLNDAAVKTIITNSLSSVCSPPATTMTSHCQIQIIRTLVMRYEHYVAHGNQC